MNFDEWRKNYDSMTFDDHQRMAGKFLELYPEQAHYNVRGAEMFLRTLVNERVLEIGGWKGDLANYVLSENKSIKAWTNFDILPVSAGDLQRPHDKRYMFHSLYKWLWEYDTRGWNETVFVATHVFEHLKWSQLQKLIGWIPQTIHTAVIEAPLNPGPTDWNGCFASHILEVGWIEIDKAMAEQGLVLTDEDPIRRYRRL